MRKAIFTFVFLFPWLALGQVDTLTLHGRLCDKGIGFTNPRSLLDTGFCTRQVLLNGKPSVTEINSSAFYILFSDNGLKSGDSLCIQIFHEKNNAPKVINPMHPCYLRPTFELISIEVDSAGILTWQTEKETLKLPYIVEQYRWNRWVQVASVDPKGSYTHAAYLIFVNIHSGENTFRIKQSLPFSTYEIGKLQATCTSKTRPPVYTLDHANKKILFSRKTMYRVYDREGNLLDKGEGTEADLKKVCSKQTIYYLCYDNLTVNFGFE